MSAKGEMYKSKTSKMKHEKGEGAKERMMEYGTKAPVRKAKAAPKKSVAKKKK